jgi:tetratricopeptide (TPR) repeat protein
MDDDDIQRTGLIATLRPPLLSPSSIEENSTFDHAHTDIALMLQTQRASFPGSETRLRLCLECLSILHALHDDQQLEWVDVLLELGREVVLLMASDHDQYPRQLMTLANDLFTKYEASSDVNFLNESISLGRSALQQYAPNHPSRASWCTSVAYWLSTRGELRDAEEDFIEAIGLEEEGIELLPANHEGRSTACGNLAVSLKHRLLRTGEDRLLDQIVSLEREALELRPPGHAERGTSCLCLAQSLEMRYEQTMDSAFLDEAITLGREALRLHFNDRVRRVQSCSSLSQCLLARIIRTYDDNLALEAIQLGREAVSCCSAIDPDRDSFRMNLAATLTIRYEHVRDLDLLDEAISLESEVQSGHHPGHPQRRIPCINLAASLKKRYDHTGQPDLLHQALELSVEALAHSEGKLDRWRIAVNMSDLFLCRETALWNIDRAIEQLQNALDFCVNNIPELLRTTAKRLAGIDLGDLSPRQHQVLMRLYVRIIHMMPLVTGFALDGSSQLRAVDWCAHIASDAFSCAVANESLKDGLELLELARGILWSQALHLRDPQLIDVPSVLSTELAGLLRDLASDLVEQRPSVRDHQTDVRTLRDLRHQQNDRVHAIIRQVRQLPGLDRFMLGPSYEDLMKSANSHPIVILVSGRAACHALVLRPPDGSMSHVDLGKIDLTSLRMTIGAALGDEAAARRGIRRVEADVPPSKTLSRLWRKVVKPIIEHLNLSVRFDVSP